MESSLDGEILKEQRGEEDDCATVHWHPVAIVRSHSLRAINRACARLSAPVALLACLRPQSVFGFWGLFQRLSGQIDTDALATHVVGCSSPHLVIERKRRKASNGRRSNDDDDSLIWVFRLPVFDVATAIPKALRSIPVVIYLDEMCAREAVIEPLWVRLKLGAVERKAVSLIALNAFVSTLGGGHYLCKHIEDAWAMALRQQAIALALGDLELAGQCRIHLAYISMQVGKLRSAQRRLRNERAFAEKIESGKLLAVVNAAEIYLNKLIARREELRLQADDRLRDGFYRQRFVDLKKKQARFA